MGGNRRTANRAAEWAREERELARTKRKRAKREEREARRDARRLAAILPRVIEPEDD